MPACGQEIALANESDAREFSLDIVDAVDALIAGRATVDEVLGALLSRPPRAEAV